MPSSRGTRREPDALIGVVLLVLSMLGAVLALGSVHTPPLCFVSVAVAAAGFFIWRHTRPFSPRSAATNLVVLAVCLVVYTALQAVPLPASFVAAIAPQNADVWSRALAPLNELGPRWHPISLDPSATRIEVLRGVLYLLTFLAALRATEKTEGIILLGGGLILSTVAVALLSIVHPALGAERVFGIYRPENPIFERNISPLLNANTLAAYLNIGICLSLGAAAVPKPPVPRALIATVALLLVAMQIWVASRGGVVAMALAISILAAVTLANRSRRRRELVKTAPLTLMAVFAVGMTVLAASKDAFKGLVDTDVSKLTMHKRMLDLVYAHKWLGVGRGAFESAYPAHRTGTGHVLYTHPEHVVLQWTSEWGVPVALVALFVIGWTLRPRVVMARSSLSLGAWVALAAGAVHNLVDLNSEIPGVAMAYVACAAIVVAGPSSSRKEDRIWDSWALHPRRLRLALGVVTFFALAGAASTWRHDLYADRFRLRDLARAEVQDDERFKDAARAAMLRHPAEPYLPFTGAMRAARLRSPDMVRWAAGTVERAAVYGPVHMIIGRALWQVSPSQARMEYRLAMTQAPELQSYVLKEAVNLVGNYEDARTLVPEGPGRDQGLRTISAAVGARLPGTQVLLDEDILRGDPGLREAVVRQVSSMTRSLREPWCAGDNGEPLGCLDRALKAAKDVTERNPASCEGPMLRAQALAAAGDAKLALDELDAVVDKFDERAGCLKAMARIANEAKLDARVGIAADKLAKVPCSGERECAANLIAAGDAETAAGRALRALVHYRRAYERYPQTELALERRATVAARAGLHVEALDCFTRLAKRSPGEARWAEAAARERQFLGAAGLTPPTL